MQLSISLLAVFVSCSYTHPQNDVHICDKQHYKDSWRAAVCNDLSAKLKCYKLAQDKLAWRQVIVTVRI